MLEVYDEIVFDRNLAEETIPEILYRDMYLEKGPSQELVDSIEEMKICEGVQIEKKIYEHPLTLTEQCIR